MKNFTLVYLVDNDSAELKDNGEDPSFDNEPSWGICRPNIRNSKKLDSGSREYNSVNYKLGYKILEIRTPREIIEI